MKSGIRKLAILATAWCGLSFGGCADDKLDHPQAEQFKEVIGDEYYTTYNEQYKKFLEHENALRLAEILGDDFSSVRLDDYIEALADCDDSTLNRLEKLKDALKDEFKGDYYLDKYIFLLNQGIDPNAIASIDSYKLGEVVEGLTSSAIPRELAPYFTPSIEEYAAQLAAQNPVFSTDRKKVRNYIKEKISKLEHCYRKDTDYEESADQIDRVENINILYLIKGYVDYFEEPKNIACIGEMIEEDIKNPFSEEGCLVIGGEKSYQFIKLDTRINEFKNFEDNESYMVPDWFKYVGHIGAFHFHATTEDSNEYAGPSGSSSWDSSFSNGDMGILRLFNEINPYEIHCVITKLKGNKFNADLYFRDVCPGFFGTRFNVGDVIVVDLGTFDFEK